MIAKIPVPLKVSTFAVTLALSLATSGMAKGLDQLQTEPEKTEEAAPAAPASSPAENSALPASQTQTQAATTPPPAVSTEPEKFFIASGMSLINLSGSKGGWHSGATSDVQAGYRFLTLQQKFDLFGTFRYRPVEVLVDADQREYRGVVETYLFGATARMALKGKISVGASAELGAAQTHLRPNDSLPTVDQSLAKSGVDLSLGGGVSYLVLDKFGVGTKIAFGTGAYKTIQFGVELRFML